MPVPWMLLRCVAKAAVKNIANLVSFGFAGEMVVDTWEYWEKETRESQRQAELQQLAQAAAQEVRQQVMRAMQAEASALNDTHRRQLEAYLQQVPAMIRKTSRRASDPTGRTIPPGVALRKADDLMRFLPAKPPRFKVGDRPLPSVDWELVELLGIGGFGEVWKAHNPHFDSVPPVALKFCVDATARDRLFQHEAAVLNQVMRQGRHQGIISLQHTYLSADPPCLEYEYIEGGDLAGLLAETRRAPGGMAPEQASRVIFRLAEILSYAHRLQPPIVHRDLKPANILVQARDGSEAFKVADFGIGGLAIKQAIDQTRQGGAREVLLSTMLRGAYTPLYASPQQMNGQDPDPRDDVYALGVIWFQLLTGDLTTGAPTGLAWAEELCDGGLSKKMVQLLGACVSARPESRPNDAGVLAQQISAQLPTVLRKKATPPPLPKDEKPTKIPQVILVKETTPFVVPVASAPPMVWKVPPWLATLDQLTDATHRFWLLGLANEFAPHLQYAAQSQSRAEFQREITRRTHLLSRHDYPLFQGEVLLGDAASATVCLTSYRLIATSRRGKIHCVPLHTIARYALQDSADRSVRQVVSITRTGGEVLRWDDLAEECTFPPESVIGLLLRMQLWKQLPSEALLHLASTNADLRASYKG